MPHQELSKNSNEPIQMTGVDRKSFSQPRSQYFGHNHDTFQYRLAKSSIRFLHRLCQFDSDSIHQRLKGIYKRHRKRRAESAVPTSLDFSSAKACDNDQGASSTTTILWPHLTFVLYLYLSFKFIITTYYLTMKFSYSAKVTKILTEAISPSGRISEQDLFSGFRSETSSESDSTSIESQLKWANDSLADVDWMLDRLGSPYEEQGLIAASAYLIIVNITFISYLIPQLYYNYGHRISFFIVNLIESEAAEFERCKQLVHKELEKFENSSWNSIRVTRAHIQMNWTGQLADHPELRLERAQNHHWTTRPDDMEGEFHGRHKAAMRLALQEHRTLTQITRSLLAGGKLMPINRSAEWFDKLVANFNQVIIGNSIYSLIFDLASAFGLPYAANVPLHLDVADIVSLIEMLVLVEFSVLTTSLGVASTISHLTDQTDYIMRLDDEMSNCIEMNEREFTELLNQHRQWQWRHSWLVQMRRKIESCSAKLNANLLESLLKYRIYTAQLRPVLDSMSLVVIVALDLTLVLPAIIRCYAPYIVSNARPVGLFCSTTFVIYADILLLPLCKFNHKGELLYKRLWSLLASAIEIDLISSEVFGRNMHAEASVAMLRKELQHPGEVLDQFVTSSLGVKATFPNLVELHFYYGILMISLYLALDSWTELLGDRLNDPLNLI